MVDLLLELESSASLSRRQRLVSLAPGGLSHGQDPEERVAAPNYGASLLGGESTWGTKSPKSRVDCEATEVRLDASVGLRLVVDRRAAPIAMAWRHHDSSVADPFPKPDEYNAFDVAKLREVVIALRKPPPTFYMLQLLHGRVLTCSTNFPKNCKVAAGALLPPDSTR
ncbi:hypothetical protein Tco_0274008, partial [Tanacetum coccineum]